MKKHRNIHWFLRHFCWFPPFFWVIPATAIARRRTMGATLIKRCPPWGSVRLGSSHYWLVVTGTMEFYDFPYIGKFIIPTDELMFFRGVGIPPTRLIRASRSKILGKKGSSSIFIPVFFGPHSEWGPKKLGWTNLRSKVLGKKNVNTVML